ncbi:MAG TPA: hypothetical protein VGO87_02215 [Acidimicrobiia bacterium]
MAEQTINMRQFTCIVATSGRFGGDGITMVTVGASDYADAPTAARRAVANRYGCACHVLDVQPFGV